MVILLLSDKPSSQTGGPAQVGKRLQDFSLTDITGKSVRLSDFAGKVVLVNAWATWCPPCKAEMPDLNTYYQAHKDDGFTLLAVNAGDSPNVTADFASERGLTFPVLLDPNVRFLNNLGIHSYPTSIVIGTDGIIKTIHVGMFTPQALEAEVTPYLAR